MAFLCVNQRDMGGADNRSRTYDLLITNELLYQLSYIGFVSSQKLYRHFLR